MSYARREVTVTRIYDAPRSLVFEMWTDPEHMAQWWGPKGFTNPVCELGRPPGGNSIAVGNGHRIRSGFSDVRHVPRSRGA